MDFIIIISYFLRPSIRLAEYTCTYLAKNEDDFGAWWKNGKEGKESWVLFIIWTGWVVEDEDVRLDDDGVDIMVGNWITQTRDILHICKFCRQ